MAEVATTIAIERFTFDAERQRYYDADGRPVSDAELKRLTFRFAEDHEEQFLRWLLLLFAGDLDLGEWQRRMNESVKRMHVAMTLAGIGGVEQLDDRTRALLHATIRFHLERLDRFARLIEARRPFANSPSSITDRAKKYIAAANVTFEEARRIAHETAGFTEELNVLSPAEHCVGDRSCPRQTALGWVPIGTLIPIGRRNCLMRCKCRISYRREREDEA